MGQQLAGAGPRLGWSDARVRGPLAGCARNLRAGSSNAIEQSDTPPRRDVSCARSRPSQGRGGCGRKDFPDNDRKTTIQPRFAGTILTLADTTSTPAGATLAQFSPALLSAHSASLLSFIRSHPRRAPVSPVSLWPPTLVCPLLPAYTFATAPPDPDPPGQCAGSFRLFAEGRFLLDPYKRVWPRRLGHSRPSSHHDRPAHLHGLLRKRSFLAGLRCPVEMCRPGQSQLRRRAHCSFTPSAPTSSLRLRCSFLRVCAYAPSRASVVSLAHSMASQTARPPRPIGSGGEVSMAPLANLAQQNGPA